MSVFLLVVNRSGDRLSEASRYCYDAARCCTTLERRWTDAGSVSIMVGGNGTHVQSEVARYGSYIGVGNVRLDNRAEIAKELSHHGADATDLELALGVVGRLGKNAVSRLLGDFAFVGWDEVSRTAIAVRDAFGVRRLFYRVNPRYIAFASRAELLAEGDMYDVDLLVSLIAMRDQPVERTVYAGVRALPPGTVQWYANGTEGASRFWSAEEFEPAASRPAQVKEAVEAFRDLFVQSVRLRLTGRPDVWSQLSGGLDSSSVASTSRWLADCGLVAHGVAGTVSWVYRWSTDGDERAFSDAVANRWRLRNDVMLGDWYWQVGQEDPPLTDEPQPEYPMYARELRTIARIRDAGGRVLLTGLGSDQYLIGNMFYFADWLARGRVRSTAREMLRVAALGRTSVWNLAYQNAFLPLLPAWLIRRVVHGATVPAWISPRITKRLGIDGTALVDIYRGRVGRKYVSFVRQLMNSVPGIIHRHLVLEDALELRHPFLYRPLVELGLQLPVELCVQPHARKWILREAMRGILPEVVRTRVGKGGNVGCIVQSLVHERPRLLGLLRNPVLAQLGAVDPRALRAAYDVACQTQERMAAGAVFYTLAIETWLDARSGRRVAGERAPEARNGRPRTATVAT